MRVFSLTSLDQFGCHVEAGSAFVFGISEQHRICGHASSKREVLGQLVRTLSHYVVGQGDALGAYAFLVAEIELCHRFAGFERLSWNDFVKRGDGLTCANFSRILVIVLEVVILELPVLVADQPVSLHHVLVEGDLAFRVVSN